MPYLLIEDFKGGMDRSRPRSVGTPGALWDAENCVVSRGGDLEKARALVELYDLPAGTFGAALVDNQIEVFASSAVAAPAGVKVRVLAAPGSPNMVQVLDVDTPAGKSYVIAKYDDGSIYHFYDGVRITDLDALADANATFEAVASYLADEMDADPAVRVDAAGDSVFVQAITPGTPFTLTASATDGGGTNDQTATVTELQANVAAVANVDSTATVTLTGGTVNAENLNRIDQISAGATGLMTASVPIAGTLSATAAQVAQRINNSTSVHGFSASADGAVLTIRAPIGTGADENGTVISVVAAGNATASKTDFAGGVDAVAPVAQRAEVVFAGTLEAQDTFSVTLNGVEHKITARGAAYGTGVLSYKQRAYLAADNVILYSKLTDVTDFTDPALSSGAGIIPVASDSGRMRASALAEYNDRVAVFGSESVSIYAIETDATSTQLLQVLRNTGTDAPRSIVAYGNLDVFYLDQTGVRSLRARDSSNAAFVSDVGTAVDGYIAERRTEVPANTIRRAQAIVEPLDGRYMLSLGDEILTLSRFSATKVSAWSVLKPGFVPGTFVRAGRDLFVRSGNKIYVYGGLSGDQFVGPNACMFQTAFMDGGSPAAHKYLTGIDLVCEGTWKIEILTNPNDVLKALHVATVTGTTLNYQRVALALETAVFAIRATCVSEGPASVSQIGIHYKAREAK